MEYNSKCAESEGPGDVGASHRFGNVSDDESSDEEYNFNAKESESVRIKKKYIAHIKLISRHISICHSI